jgi:hypothetical protein
MRETMTILTAIVILAIAQTLTTALGIVLLIFALMGVVAFPRPTFGLIASLGLLILALREPAVCAAALGAIGVTCVLADRLRRQRRSEGKYPLVPLLSYNREQRTEADDQRWG